MNHTWNHIDLFSGANAFRLGFENAGFKITNHYYSEIDKHAIANTRYNYPSSEYIGSVTDVSGLRPEGRTFITFGWPCQDNSIAGKRKGHAAGTRSGLLFEAVRIIDEVRPEFFCAENVEGLRTVNKGIDIVEAVKYLAFLNESLPQYDVEMQLLNTRWFLPQNRERLYFVGHLRNGSSRQVFPIGENDLRFNEGAAKPAVVRCFTAGGNSGGLHSGMTLIRQINPSLESGGKQPYQQNRIYDASGIVPALAAQLGKGMAIARMVGRNIVDGKRKDIKGAPTLQRIEPNAEGISNCLTSVQKDNLVICNTNMSGQTFENEFSGTLRADASANYMTVNNIRRLTPIECERLQGWPDNHTAFGHYEDGYKPISDTQRYRLCGNGVSEPCVRAVAQKLHALYHQQQIPKAA